MKQGESDAVRFPPPPRPDSATAIVVSRPPTTPRSCTDIFYGDESWCTYIAVVGLAIGFCCINGIFLLTIMETRQSLIDRKDDWYVIRNLTLPSKETDVFKTKDFQLVVYMIALVVLGLCAVKMLWALISITCRYRYSTQAARRASRAKRSLSSNLVRETVRFVLAGISDESPYFLWVELMLEALEFFLQARAIYSFIGAGEKVIEYGRQSCQSYLTEQVCTTWGHTRCGWDPATAICISSGTQGNRTQGANRLLQDAAGSASPPMIPATPPSGTAAAPATTAAVAPVLTNNGTSVGTIYFWLFCMAISAIAPMLIAECSCRFHNRIHGPSRRKAIGFRIRIALLLDAFCDFGFAIAAIIVSSADSDTEVLDWLVCVALFSSLWFGGSRIEQAFRVRHLFLDDATPTCDSTEEDEQDIGDEGDSGRTRTIENPLCAATVGTGRVINTVENHAKSTEVNSASDIEKKDGSVHMDRGSSRLVRAMQKRLPDAVTGGEVHYKTLPVWLTTMYTCTTLAVCAHLLSVVFRLVNEMGVTNICIGGACRIGPPTWHGSRPP